jgi:hypothetical protein
MMQALFSFILFAGILAGVGFGASWLVDNRTELFPEKESHASISELLNSVAETVDEAMSLSDEENESPSETEELPEIDRDKLDVSILNGGTVAGAAGSLAEKLQAIGYTEAQAGNASSYDHTGVSVYFSDDLEVEASVVAQDIRSISEYENVEISTKVASSSDQKRSDIVVILGE